MEDHIYEIRMSDKGRGLFAKRVIKNGEVILQEKPLVCTQFAWNGDPIYPYSACDYCLSPLDTAEENVRRLSTCPDITLPFPQCSEVKKETIVECDACNTKYCSPECKIEAQKRYHQTICMQSKENNEAHPLSVLLNTWKQIHYPPETCSIMLIVKMVALVRQNPEMKPLLMEFCNKTSNEDDSHIMHNLLKEKFETCINDIRILTQKSIDTEHVPEWFTPEGFKSLLALIGTNSQGIGTSSFAAYVKNIENLELDNNQRNAVEHYIDSIYDQLDQVVGSFLNNEGSGLYYTQSKVNHSCVPNADIEFPFSNSTLVLKAIKDISEDEEIYISYIDECELSQSRHSRQKLLRNMYLFQCKCEKCLSAADDSDENLCSGV